MFSPLKKKRATWDTKYYMKEKEAKKQERIRTAKVLLQHYKEWKINELDVVDISQVQYKVKAMVKANNWKWVVPKSTGVPAGDNKAYEFENVKMKTKCQTTWQQEKKRKMKSTEAPITPGVPINTAMIGFGKNQYYKWRQEEQEERPKKKTGPKRNLSNLDAEEIAIQCFSRNHTPYHYYTPH